MKHFFDQIYYPCLKATVGRPYALYVHGNSDTTGDLRSVETIATGLKRKRLREPLAVIGEVDAAAREACWNLGATGRRSRVVDGGLRRRVLGPMTGWPRRRPRRVVTAAHPRGGSAENMTAAVGLRSRCAGGR